ILRRKADLFVDEHDYRKAAELDREALEILEAREPRSIDYAEVLSELARTLGKQGDLDAAATLYEKTLTILDLVALDLGDEDDDHSLFRAWYVPVYKDYIEVLLKQNNPDKALEIAERSRAQTLLQMVSHA